MKKEMDLKGLLHKNPASVTAQSAVSASMVNLGGRPTIDGRGTKRDIYKYVNVALSPETFKAAKIAHKARDLTMTEYINMLIDQDLEKNGSLYEAFGSWKGESKFK